MTDTRQRAIEDVARAFSCDAEILRAQVEMDPRYLFNNAEYKVYAVTQRERVLILEAENAELKAKLEGQWNSGNPPRAACAGYGIQERRQSDGTAK